MIHEVFELLKDKLNTYFRTLGILEDKVDFVVADTTDETLKFPLNQLTPTLINIEEERIMRQPDLYSGRSGSTITSENAPEIRINLLVLFVSKFSDYPEGLNFLSHVIKFFQVNRVFDHHNTPTLSPEIEKLIMELSPPVLQEQDAVWNALRTSYLPSVLYKIKMLVYVDQESYQAASQVTDVGVSLNEGEFQMPGQVTDVDMDISQVNAPPLPQTDIPVKDNSLFVDYDTPAIVDITDSEAGITYQLFTSEEEQASGEAVTSESDGEIVTLTSDNLIADTDFRIKATNLATGGETWLENTVSVEVNNTGIDINTNLPVSGSSIVTYNEQATIRVENSQDGVEYQLIGNDGTLHGNPVPGVEGQAIDLLSNNLEGDTTFSIEARLDEITATLNNTATVLVGRLYNNDYGDYIDFNNPSELIITGDQTIEMWIKPDAFDVYNGQALYFKGYSDYSAYIFIMPDGSMFYQYKTGTGSFIALYTEQLPGPDQWIHLAVTRDTTNNGLVQWHINGQPVANTPTRGEMVLDGDSHAVIGGRTDSSNLIGLVAEVRVWNIARTAQQIEDNMGKRLDGPQNGLVAYWKMDEGTGTTVNDSSGNDLHGTMQGSTWLGETTE